MRVFSISRLTSLHKVPCTKCRSAVFTQIGQVRHFVAQDLGSNRTLWRTRLLSGRFDCETSRTLLHVCKRQCIRYLSTRNAYDEAFTTSRDNPEKFWSAAAQNISWFEPWHQLLDKTDVVFPQWWVSSLFGQTNIFRRGMRKLFVQVYK